MSLASRYYHASLTYAKRHLSQLDPDYYPLPIQIQVMQIKDRSDRKGRDILSPRKEAAKRKNELVIQTFLCSFRDIIYNISYVTATIVRSERRRRRKRSGEGGKNEGGKKNYLHANLWTPTYRQFKARRYFPSRQPHEKCEHNAAEGLKRASRIRYSAWWNRNLAGGKGPEGGASRAIRAL